MIQTRLKKRWKKIEVWKIKKYIYRKPEKYGKNAQKKERNVGVGEIWPKCTKPKPIKKKRKKSR